MGDVIYNKLTHSAVYVTSSECANYSEWSKVNPTKGITTSALKELLEENKKLRDLNTRLNTAVNLLSEELYERCAELANTGNHGPGFRTATGWRIWAVNNGSEGDK